MIVTDDVIISLQAVSYYVTSGSRQLHILNDINFSVKSGASMAISGVSGSGKTTLLNLIAGLEKPSSGQIYFQQQNITQLSTDDLAALRAKRLSFIFQSFRLIPSLTAIENVMLPLEINCIANTEQQARQWLKQVGLQDRATHYPQQLSGGEQQRVAIARAFAIQPQLLLADEPTGNLDKQTAQQIIELLFDLNQRQQTTLLIVTHDEYLAQRCQLHAHLDGGCLTC